MQGRDAVYVDQFWRYVLCIQIAYLQYITVLLPVPIQTADISKSLASKRKRLEGFTQASLKTSNKKVDEVWKTQHEERSDVIQVYRQ